MDTNNAIADCFEKYSKLLVATDANSFKIKSYINAADTLRRLDQSVDEIDYIKLKGIGKSLSGKIYEYLQNGQCKFLEDLEHELINKKGPRAIYALKLFMEINNIGPNTAKNLVFQHGITTIDELERNKDLLNKNQQLGLKYYKDSHESISRSEMVHHEEFLMEVGARTLLSNERLILTGSYRRGDVSSGDIDVLIGTRRNTKDVLDIISKALKTEKYIIDIIGQRNQKLMAYCRLPFSPNYTKIRRLDIYVTDQKEYPFALLHWTGNKNFNIELRKIAIELGWKLSEHSMINKKNGQKFRAQNEEEILEALGVGYIPPPQRTKKILESRKLNYDLLTEDEYELDKGMQCFKQLINDYPNLHWNILAKTVYDAGKEANKPRIIELLLDYKHVIYTDGSSRNKKQAGWGFVVYTSNENKVRNRSHGPEYGATNVRMEMHAVYEALSWLNQQSNKWSVTFYIDNDMVQKTITDITTYFKNKKLQIDYGKSYLGSWKKKGWKKADGKPPLNLDLWKKIDQELMTAWNNGCVMKAKWVKGHSSSVGNIEADREANLGADESKK